MPPRRFSRYIFSRTFVESDGAVLLTGYEPYTFRNLPDNRHHKVRTGDTLFHLAGKYFRPLPRPKGLWWIIADFQPVPIIDPTRRLPDGKTLVIPSVRTVMTEIFNERRRAENS